MTDLIHSIKEAAAGGRLLESSAANMIRLLGESNDPLHHASIAELVEAGAWEELNDRFFKSLAFGTGGLRGRTIGKIVTKAEAGEPQPLGRPQFPCVGTNALNFFNVGRATRGLACYLRQWFEKEGRSGRPKLAIAYDSRHFSSDFAELAAEVASVNGVDVVLFTEPRSTPELSFTVRYTQAQAGIVITASHNPPHDNGFKVYFEDGAQVVEPHASGIIAEVNTAPASDAAAPEGERGVIERVDTALDAAYLERLETLVLDRNVVREASGLKIVFTNIHGTGGVISVPILQRLGFGVSVVAEQAGFDGRFPTVKSPNPENAEALALAIAQAEREEADLVVATDPDCDRMGVAVRNAHGKMELLNGNQIGSLMAWYRATTFLRQGVLHSGNLERGVIIKTLVTTDLQKAIAERLGLACVETLTGFKYIGAKLTKYEKALPEFVQREYRQLAESETRSARLAESRFYVFGGEESYGYSGADFTRDKDGNGAVVMFAEVAAYAKWRGITLDQLLDEIYCEYGFYLERNTSLTFEGAEGAAKIQRLVASYAAQPAKELDGVAVTRITDFAREEVFDSEGDLLPKEAMLILELEDGRRVAVRPSGTEPKIKFYFFGRAQPPFDGEGLASVKEKVSRSLDRLWQEIQADVERRLASTPSAL